MLDTINAIHGNLQTHTKGRELRPALLRRMCKIAKLSDHGSSEDMVTNLSTWLVDTLAAEGLEPILSQGDRVTFDPAQHSSNDPLEPGDQVMVLRSGWAQHSNIVRRPEVTGRTRLWQ